MAEAKKKSVFEVMSAIDISPYVFSKNGQSYLPWSRAVELLKLKYPDARITECTFAVKEFVSAVAEETKEGKKHENILINKEMPYFTDGNTCYVKTRLEIPSEALDEYCTLPILDFKNKSMTANTVTMDAVNKSLRRCATKNIAMATGLGLSLWHKEETSETAEAAKILTEFEQNSAIDKFKALIAKGFDRNELVKWLQTNFKTSNPRTIKNEDVLDKLAEELDKLDIKDFQPVKTKKKED